MDEAFGGFEEFDAFAEEQQKPQKEMQKLTRKEKVDLREEKYKAHLETKRKEKREKGKQARQEQLQQCGSQEQRRIFVQQLRQQREDKRALGLEARKSAYRVVIDCGFEDNMNVKEQRSLARQLFELYTENRRAKHPVQLYFAGLYPVLKAFLNNFNYDKWPVHLDDRRFDEIEGLANFVYLSPDGEEVLEEIKPEEVYVIGGLVDKMILKNATLNRSKLLNVRSARLPIAQFIKPSYKKCLNVSTAALMVPAWLELRSWEQAFERIVPPKFKKLEQQEKQEMKGKCKLDLNPDQGDQSIASVEVQFGAVESKINHPPTDQQLPHPAQEADHQPKHYEDSQIEMQ